MVQSTQAGAGVLREAKQEGRDAATSRGMTLLARAGYAAKGIVYLIIGGLAAKVALGAGGGSTTDRNGALRAIHEQPFGRFLLAVVAIGLVGYALWSFIQAVVDPENEGSDAKGIVARVAYGAVGVSYAALALAAGQLAIGTGNGGKSSDTTTQDWTARLLGLPFGPFLIILVGIVVLAVAGYLFYRSYSAEFKDKFALEKLSEQARKAIIALGRVGYAALGVVFGIVAIFLMIAAARHKAGAAKGLGGALGELAQQPYGHILLGVVALGLMAYGFFSFAQARYRRLRPA